MVILVLGELLGAVGFCGAELFFVLGVVLLLISRVIVIFKGYLPAPPDTMNYTRIACNCQYLFVKLPEYFYIFWR
jgi:hypothetical protein